MTRLSLQTLMAYLLLSSTITPTLTSESFSDPVSSKNKRLTSTTKLLQFAENVSRQTGDLTRSPAGPPTVPLTSSSPPSAAGLQTIETITQTVQSISIYDESSTYNTISTSSPPIRTTSPPIRTTSPPIRTADLQTTTKESPTNDSSTTTTGSAASTTAPQTTSLTGTTDPSTSTTAPRTTSLTGTTGITSTASMTTTRTTKAISGTTVVQERPKPGALSSASLAVIVCGVALTLVLLFGGLYFYKMRRTSYGPLLESGDYGTLGNFSNPMYDP